MIRVRLLSEREYAQLKRRGQCADYEESQFYDLLREKEDFTDADSLALLRYLHGEEIVAGNWYRRTTKSGRPCLPALSAEAKYGLVVVENSNRGIYTTLEKGFTDFEVQLRMETVLDDEQENPLVWDAFAEMDTDILLTFRKKDFSFAWKIPIRNELILENAPINGIAAEAHVVSEYLSRPEQRNGVWYIQNFFYDQRYHWTREPEDLLEAVRQETLNQAPLARGKFSMTDFLRLCRSGYGEGVFPSDPLWQEWEEAELSDSSPESEEDPWRVINHVDFAPREGESRRLLYLLIESYPDGSCCLQDVLSVKYPNYQEILEDALSFIEAGRETFMLVVDVDEVMTCSADIGKALCAYRLSGAVLETFGPVEGLREFGMALRKAIDSGRCRIFEEDAE